MVDKMMRVSGRALDGTAKAIKTDNEGALIVKDYSSSEKSYIGDFVEPYDPGYVGNVAISGLEVFGKINSGSFAIADLKSGRACVYVLRGNLTLQKFGKTLDDETPIWVYSGFSGTDAKMIAVDKNDDVIISGENVMGHRIIEKISGQTGLLLWKNVYNSSNYLPATDIAVDKDGYVYSVGPAGSNSTPYEKLLIKYNGSDGTVVWSHKYTTVPGYYTGILIDKNGYIYTSNESEYGFSILKLDQVGTNVVDPPTIMWTYTLTETNALLSATKKMALDKDGYLYVLAIDFGVLKLDQSLAGETTPPTVVWIKKYGKISGEPLLDTSGNLYTSVGKLDKKGEDAWGGESPIAFHDLRDGYIFGVQEVLGYLPEINYNVLKIGLDLQLKGLKGVR